jgi:hypothetical protein
VVVDRTRRVEVIGATLVAARLLSLASKDAEDQDYEAHRNLDEV